MSEHTSLALQDQAEITPMSLIQQATAAGASIEQIQQLFDLKLRVEADEAKKAFNAAMARFKASPPRIRKNKDVVFGQTKYSHATLDHVTDQITEALSRVGIAHKWAVEQSQGAITVSCILTHEKGHSEATTLSAGADSSGSKNAIQAIGSAVTYLQRYTLLAATGMAASNSDDDGQAAGERLGDEEFIACQDAMEASRTFEELRGVFVPTFKKAKALNDTSSMAQLTRSYEKCKKELA